jgi:hypothetical protein
VNDLEDKIKHVIRCKNINRYLFWDDCDLILSQQGKQGCDTFKKQSLGNVGITRFCPMVNFTIKQIAIHWTSFGLQKSNPLKMKYQSELSVFTKDSSLKSFVQMDGQLHLHMITSAYKSKIKTYK